MAWFRSVLGLPVLAKLGYKQETTRPFNKLTTWALNYTNTYVLLNIPPMKYALNTGGPPNVLWSFWPVTLIVCCVALSMAELCSAMPTMGGLSNFAARVGGPKWGPYAAWYVCIVLLYSTNQDPHLVNPGTPPGSTTSPTLPHSAYLCVVIRQLNSDWAPETQELRNVEYGFYVAIVAFVAFINIVGENYLPTISQWSSYLIFIGTMVIAIYPMARIGRDNLADTSFVFLEWQNGTEVDSKALVALIGLFPAAWNVVGIDASSHISEETTNSTTSATTSLVFTVIAGGVGGFFLWVCQLFIIQDLDAVLNGEFDPYVETWLLTVGPGPTTGFLLVVFFSFTMTACASVVVTSRMFFSLVRDQALPFSSFWYYILFGLFTLFSDVVFPALTSVSTVCFFISTVIPLRITVAKDTFKPGPWNLGSWTFVSGWIAVIFVAFLSVIFMLPTEYPVDPSLSNFPFAPLVFGVVLIFVNVWWFAVARHSFKGPVKTVSDEEVRRLEETLEVKPEGARVGVSEGVAVVLLFHIYA
ncbi:hypothetical protein M427DRAFT_133693 [Gonapodya prolifera JEL478]|uniref:Amino acid permease/ SLC12A domain-containing protein n=1 Tax=Gonapodya prolifera (strain JEL478) TaxID=1344416 RepID=A0A139ALG3_GONPJ|nr:hypothetical protein M427DRAFT_133693 [Gonapodya prolifera JEL478]|eukprot:KXS17265.1 hypothetical protein M427DRAFT_133693 [Gonapodya prolifera JEL478]